MSDFWGDRAGPGLKARLQGVDPRPDHSEIVNACRTTLVEGQDPVPGGRETRECPECGYEEVVGRETMGPDITGFEETLQEVAGMFDGSLSGDEFRECVENAVEEAFESVEDDAEDMTAEVHLTLPEFGQDEEDE